MFELLKNPDVIKLLGAAGGIGSVLGFVFKALLPYLRRAVKTEHQLAEEALSRALRTPQKDDDDAAQKRLDWIKRIEAQISEAK